MKTAAAAVLVLCLGAGWLGSASVRDMDKKIKSQKKDLERLNEKLQDLESEKSRLKKEEDNLLRTLKKIDGAIEQSVKKQVRLQKQVRRTELQMKQKERDISLYSSESRKWEESLVADLRRYYVRVAGPARLVTASYQGPAYRAQMGLKFESMKSAELRKNILIQKERELAGHKRKLTGLKAEAEDETLKQKKSQAEKNEIYKTTAGKRLIAEEQARQLRETAESMEAMLDRLIRRKEKTLAAQREAELAKKTFKQKHGQYPWPAEGAVVSPYGRQIHPDLKITVHNNGIRIRTAAQAPVKAVEKGAVIYADDFRSYGRTVILDHGGDSYSIYGLLGEILVQEGEKVPQLKVLGRAADGTDAQVYFEIKIDGQTQNPLSWLK